MRNLVNVISLATEILIISNINSQFLKLIKLRIENSSLDLIKDTCQNKNKKQNPQ